MWKIIIFITISIFVAISTNDVARRSSISILSPKEKLNDKYIILLTFKGYSPKIPCWNRRRFSPSELSQKSITNIQIDVVSYFNDYDVIITTDDSLYNNFAVDRRLRVVITSDVIIEDSGGISIYNALYFKDTTASLVSTIALDYDNKAIAIAIVHEIGHVLGLAHQAVYKGAYMIQAYNIGDSLVGPIMGAPYWSKTAVWTKGTNDYGQYQDDTAIISKTFKKINK